MTVTVTYTFKPEEIPQMISAAIEALPLVPRLLSQAVSSIEDCEDLTNPAPAWGNQPTQEEIPPRPFSPEED